MVRIVADAEAGSPEFAAVRSRRSARVGAALYWFFAVLAWLFLIAAAALDVFRLWGAMSLGERWLLNSVALLVFVLIWGFGWACRYALAGR
jgi:hypothetical protein